MSAFERLLVPGCTELPECRCGIEMLIASIEQLPERSDAGIRVYNCPACRHEMRLTVWTIDATAPTPNNPTSFLKINVPHALRWNNLT